MAQSQSIITTMMQLEYPDKSNEPVHDDEFYLAHGDILFRVNNTLFRVHKSVVSQESSVFQDMLKICASGDSAPIEGMGDNNALVLTGDSTEAFRILLGMLYALPDEMYRRIKDLKRSILNILALAAIANKYHFVSTESLAITLLRNRARKDREDLCYHESTFLEGAIETVMLLNERDLEKDFIRIYSEHILLGNGEPLVTLEFANQYSLRPLQGACHYAYLLHQKHNQPKKFGVSKLGPHDLEEGFRRRILAGHWSLMEVCESLSSSPPLKEEICKKFRIYNWYTDWSRCLQVKSSDPLLLMRTIRHKLEEKAKDGARSKAADEALEELDKNHNQARLGRYYGTNNINGRHATGRDDQRTSIVHVIIYSCLWHRVLPTTMKVGPADQANQVMHDDEFYFDDGDIVFLVNNTLFRVHKSVVGRDSSVFQDMFKDCAGGSAQIEGTDDKNALILTGDSTDAFKILLGLLYALPDEMYCRIKDMKDDFADILALAAIANKYHFVSTEALTVRLLRSRVLKARVRLRASPSKFLEGAIKTVMLLNDRDLEKEFIRIYSEHILYGHGKPLVTLHFANLYSLRPLQGACHYAYLNLQKKKAPETFGVSTLGRDHVDEGFRRRLLAGHWSLMKACQSLYKSPPLSEDVCKEFSIHDWYKDWKGQRSESSDPLSLLQILQYQLREKFEDEDEDADAVLQELDEVIQTFKDNLMDHFDV